MKIISFLGLAGTREDAKSAYYENKIKELKIQSGKYKNMAQALLEVGGATIIYFGTNDAIEANKAFLNTTKHINYLPFDKNNYKGLFDDILGELNTDEDVFIDMTHGFRENTFIGTLAGVISLNSKSSAKINFIMAKEIVQLEKYEINLVDEYINLARFSFVFSAFIQYLKVPDMNLNIDIYKYMKNFSDFLLSNQIKKAINEYKNIINWLDNAQNSELKHFDDLYEQIRDELECFSQFDTKYRYEQYFDIARLMHSKGYDLNASNFLIEAIPLYLYETLKPYISSKQARQVEYDYQVSKLLNKALYLDVNKCSYIDTIYIENDDLILYLKYDFFVENKTILRSLNSLKKDISDIRNEISHVEFDSNQNVKKGLKEVISDFEFKILEKDILKDLILPSLDNAKSQGLQEIINEHFTDLDVLKSLQRICDTITPKSLTSHIKFYKEKKPIPLPRAQRDELNEVFAKYLKADK